MENSLNKRMTRRRLTGVVGGLAGVAAFAAAGCGGPQAAGNTDPTQQKGDLQWMIAAHTPETQSWFEKTLIPAFQKERPKATVTMTYVQWAELFEKRGALFAAGSGPDVIQAGADDTVEYVKNKWTIKLDDRLAKWKDWSDYYDVPKEATKYENHTTGIPAQIRPRALYLRKDLFEKRGAKIPTTWDEMKTAAVALTERNGDEVTVSGFNPSAMGYQQFFPMVWQAGGEMASPDLKKVLFNTPQVVDGPRFWNDLFNQIQPPGTKLAAAPQGVPQLLAGTYASQVDAQSQIDTAVKRFPELVDKIAIRPPLKKEKAMSFFSTNWFCLGNQSKTPDLSWDLLTTFMKGENLLEYNRTTSTIIPRKSMRNSGFMGDTRYQMSAWIEVVEKYAKPHPPIVNINEVNKLMSATLGDVRNNKKSPKEGVEELARGMQQIFDEFMRR